MSNVVTIDDYLENLNSKIMNVFFVQAAWERVHGDMEKPAL